MDIDPKVASVVKALALTENGGKIPDTPVSGQSGEMKSIFQFTPGTWKGYSREIIGQEAPMTKENEAAVVYGKVHNWLQAGYSPEEIASMWNSGKPDAYLQGKAGVNKYGVKYDVPGYVAKFKKYLGSSGSSESKSQEAQARMPQQQKKAAFPTAPTVAPTVAPSPLSQNIKEPKKGILPDLAMRKMKQVRQV